MNCKKIEKLLYLYRNGELKKREAQTLQRHLDGCAACRSVLEQLRKIDNALEKERERAVSSVSLPLPVMAASAPHRFNWLFKPAPRLAMAAMLVVMISVYSWQEVRRLQENRLLQQRWLVPSKSGETIDLKKQMLLQLNTIACKERIIEWFATNIPAADSGNLTALEKSFEKVPNRKKTELKRILHECGVDPTREPLPQWVLDKALL
jgi:hypothetical protein